MLKSEVAQAKEQPMKRLLIALIAAIPLVLMTVPAQASGTIVVRGVQSSPVETCNGIGSLGTYEMTGDLVGCWYTDTFAADRFAPSGTAGFHGTEHFVGCVDVNGDGNCSATDPWGTFHTTFTFSAKFDAAGNEIHGRCHHPVIGGSGAFADIHGVINFHDNVGAVVTADYSGPLSF
jgi:hypothetical protein